MGRKVRELCSICVSCCWCRGTWSVQWRLHGVWRKSRIGFLPSLSLPFLRSHKLYHWQVCLYGAYNDRFMITSRSLIQHFKGFSLSHGSCSEWWFHSHLELFFFKFIQSNSFFFKEKTVSFLCPSLFEQQSIVMIGSWLYLDLRLLCHDPQLSCGILGLIRSGDLVSYLKKTGE